MLIQSHRGITVIAVTNPSHLLRGTALLALATDRVGHHVATGKRFCGGRADLGTGTANQIVRVVEMSISFCMHHEVIGRALLQAGDDVLARILHENTLTNSESLGVSDLSGGNSGKF